MPGKAGSEKRLSWMRRSTIAVSYTQAATVASNLVYAGTNGTNTIGAGGPVGSAVAGDAGTTLGWPTGYTLTYNESNLYPGGLLCQPNFEFVIVAIGIRVKPMMRITGAVVTVHPWMDVYQARAQAQILENLTIQVQRRNETCVILLENGAQYPTGFPTYQPLVSSPNSLADGPCLVIPLPEGIPVGAYSLTATGATPDTQINAVIRAHTLVHDNFGDTDAQLTAADPGILPIEFQYYGYCRCRRRDDVCEPGGYAVPMAPPARQQGVPG